MTAKRSSGKSILANFSAFSQQGPANESAGSGAEKAPAASPVTRVGAGVIGATQRSLSELREQRDRLQALVDAGGAVEIDPKMIDPSPFPDRLPDDNDVEFEQLKKLMAEEGQRVPIQVRPHPSRAERYQVVYGHRRWRAARELGSKIKAIVTPLTDSELVVSQGIENAARQDLSWIERALFACRMDDAGIKAREIRAALSIDDPELARFRLVCRKLPADVIEGIGRAPKTGRPRWVALATAAERAAGGLERVRKTLSADKVLPSDERFSRALAAVQDPKERTTRNEIVLEGPQGEKLGRARFGQRDVKLSVEGSQAAAFNTFLEEELPLLVRRFFSQREGE